MEGNSNGKKMTRSICLPIMISLELEKKLGYKQRCLLQNELEEWCKNEIKFAYAELDSAELLDIIAQFQEGFNTNKHCINLVKCIKDNEIRVIKRVAVI